jgi:putative hydrolase of the HAD superfamily
MRAAIFDLGGVVLESPMEAIAGFEQRHGIEFGTINRVVADSGAHGAWARHERGEISTAVFLEAFRDEFAAVGIEVDTTELMADIDASIRIRPHMLRAVDQLRRAGVKVAALTNNWTPFGSDGLARHFDVVVESVVEGTRKPEPRIYRICLERLGVQPVDCVMLDDLGPNLKPARDLGMTTVKVTSGDQALSVLADLFGLKIDRS